MTQDPIIDVRHLNFYYGEKRALEDISLKVTPNLVTALIGPSGCGKSTVLRIIAGLGEATTGTVEWPTADYDDAGRPHPEIGFVFQEPTLMPWATVFGNVWLPLRLKGRSKTAVRDEVMQALAMVGLENFADSYPRELSGGMKMRVSIARALVTAPRVLLMDEPFAALDEQNKLLLQAELLRIWEETRKTVLYVTHSIDEAIVLADRIMVMSARPGRIKEIVDVRAVFGRPRRVEAVKSSEQYGEMFGRIWGQLRDEVAAASAEQRAEADRELRDEEAA